MYRSFIGKLLTTVSLGTVMLLQGCGQPDGLSGSSAHANAPAYPALREGSVSVTPTYDERTAMEATAEIRRQNALTTPAPTGAVKPTMKPITPVPHVAGVQAGAGTIIENPLTPMLPGYAIENLWYTKTTTETLYVFAGAFKHDKDQGVVTVAYRTLGELKATRQSVYRTTPQKIGALHITGADGMRLFLQAKDGTKFTFDVEKAEFEP